MNRSEKDPWLQRWLRLLRERAGALPIFELGCGSGDDTAVLCGAGLEVIALDRSPGNIEQARINAPAAQFLIQDMRDDWPAQLAGLGVVVASLSLHYFSWPETHALVERIQALLRVGGVLLCRVNSVSDHNYGASGHPRIDDNYYSVDGEPKRFFDEPALDELFGSWRVLAKEETIIHRYPHPKCVWEIVLERSA